MTDETARFAALLARSVGRLDWWNVYEEHTDYEWNCQVAMYAAEPWGERREDIRQAYHSANLICTRPGVEVDNEEFNKIYRTLISYLPCDKEQKATLSPAEQAALAKISNK